ncbi:MAG: PaaI family thioesterase [Beijerinckiaceae bacterium]
MTSDARPGRMTIAELEAFLDRDFPQMNHGEKTYFVEAVGDRSARVRLIYHEKHLRPGGTLSGPSMFALADFALYCAILASIGPIALAVTTNLSINFLSKPGQKDLLADCRLLKLGKRLAVGEVNLRSDGEDDVVAHAVGTYSIPPER